MPCQDCAAVSVMACRLGGNVVKAATETYTYCDCASGDWLLMLNLAEAVEKLRTSSVTDDNRKAHAVLGDLPSASSIRVMYR